MRRVTDSAGRWGGVAQLIGSRWTFYAVVELRAWGVAVSVSVSGAYVVLGPFLVGAMRRRVPG